MRWLVCRRPIREPRFGETRRDVSAWCVTPYLTTPTGDRHFLGEVVPFPTLTAAHRFARKRADHFHRRARRQSQYTPVNHPEGHSR